MMGSFKGRKGRKCRKSKIRVRVYELRDYMYIHTVHRDSLRVDYTYVRLLVLPIFDFFDRIMVGGAP